MLDNLGLGLPPGGPLVGRPRPKRGGEAQTLAPSLLQAAPSPLPPPSRPFPLPFPHGCCHWCKGEEGEEDEGEEKEGKEERKRRRKRG